MKHQPETKNGVEAQAVESRFNTVQFNNSKLEGNEHE